MTHVFFIHSSICLEMTLRIISYLNLKNHEVFILNSRNIKGIPQKYSSHNLDYSFDYFSFFTLRELPKLKWLISKKIIRKWDHLVDRNIDGSFIFYAQNGRHYKYRVISSHSRCKGVNYFEDGIDFYMTLGEFSVKYRDPLSQCYKVVNYLLGKFLGVYHRIRQESTVFPNPNGDAKLYVLTDASAKHLTGIIPEKVVLDSKREVKHMELPSGSIIICFSALEEQGVVANDKMMKGYLDFLQSLEVSYEGGIYLRFHPAQKHTTRLYIMGVLKDYQIEILSDEIIIEEFIASQNNNVKILSCGSSVLNYALVLNERVECFALFRAIENYSGLTRRSSQWRDTLLSDRVNLTIWVK